MGTQTKPLGDLEFTSTILYKKYKHVFSLMENIPIPHSLKKPIVQGSIFPIQFTPLSPVYFLRITANITTSSNDSKTFLHCETFLRQSQYRNLDSRRIVGENQLLLSSRILVIPLGIFVITALQSQTKSWDNLPTVNERTRLKPCLLEIMTVSQYINCCANSKCVQNNLPFRRLPECLSIGNFYKYGEILTKYHEVQDLLVSKPFMCYWKGHFNLNSSLSHIRNHTSLNGMNKIESQNKAELSPKKSPPLHELPSPLEGKIYSSQNSRKRREGSSLHKKNSDEHSDNAEVASKDSSREVVTVPCGKGEVGEDGYAALERSLRKRHKAVKEEKRERKKNKDAISKPSRNSRYSESSNGANHHKEEYEGASENNVSHLRRSTRRITTVSNTNSNDINQKPNMLLPTPSLDDESAKSSPSPSDVQKKPSKSSSIKAKAKEVIKKWATEQEFMEEYCAFYLEKTSQQPRIPKMGWLEVNVFKLFKAAVSRGGYDEVTRKLLWKDVYKALNSTTIVSNAATTIRSHYRKLLYLFEEHLLKDTEEGKRDLETQHERAKENESPAGMVTKEAADTGTHDIIRVYEGTKERPCVNGQMPDFRMESILNMRNGSDMLCHSSNSPTNAGMHTDPKADAYSDAQSTDKRVFWQNHYDLYPPYYPQMEYPYGCEHYQFPYASHPSYSMNNSYSNNSMEEQRNPRHTFPSFDGYNGHHSSNYGYQNTNITTSSLSQPFIGSVRNYPLCHTYDPYYRQFYPETHHNHLHNP